MPALWWLSPLGIGDTGWGGVKETSRAFLATGQRKMEELGCFSQQY